MRTILTAAAIVAALLTTAGAAPVNFSTVLTDPDGAPIRDGDQKVMTLGRAAMMALMGTYPEDVAASTEEKMRRGLLAQRVYNAGREDVSAEDVVLIKKYIGKLPVMIVTRAVPLLEGKEDAPAKK